MTNNQSVSLTIIKSHLSEVYYLHKLYKLVLSAEMVYLWRGSAQWWSQLHIKGWAPYSQHRPLSRWNRVHMCRIWKHTHWWGMCRHTHWWQWLKTLSVPKPLLLLRLPPFHLSCGNRDKLYGRGSAPGGSCVLGWSRGHPWPLASAGG